MKKFLYCEVILSKEVIMDKNFAVIFDGDNISSEYLDAIMTEISKKGDITIKRVYADFTTPNMKSWKEKVFDSPIRVFQQFRNGPNATDNTIIMDSIELAIQNKNINAFCIVSTDFGYYSLALRLRENGKYVIGIGRENSKDIWQNSCNEFITIENILKGKELLEEKQKNVSNNESIKSIESGLDVIEYGLFNSRVNTDGWISFSDFGLTIRMKYPNFDPRSFMCNNLLQLIRKFPNDLEIKSDDCFPPNYWLRDKEKYSKGEK